MKTKIITALCLSAFAYSCNTAHYRMNTAIDRDGSATREITTAADSAFLSGDMSKNPFLFSLDERWEISVSDSVTTGYPAGRHYVTIKRSAETVDGFSDGLRYDSYKRSLAAPTESLKRRFGWFYTYYDFKAVYPEISDKGDIPISAYLSPEEQALWFQGNMSPYTGLNGIELTEALGDIETKFWNWYNRSVYDIYIAIALEFAETSSFAAALAAEKDNIFAAHSKNIEPAEFTFDDFCTMLGNHLSTTYFSLLYSRNKEAIDSEVEARTAIMELFDTTISYRLTMPGKIVSTNAPLSDNGAPEWKIDAWRLLAADLTLTAKSRTPNYWAWLITLLLAATPICLFTAARKPHNRKSRV